MAINNKEKFQSFDIMCIKSSIYKIDAKVSTWIEKKENPRIDEVETNQGYTYKGIYDVKFMKYTDSENRLFIVSDIRYAECFYKLYKLLEDIDIKMLIKGCCVDYYMVKFLKDTLLTMKLELGKRVDYKTHTVNIFKTVFNYDKVVKIEEQDIYYKNWLESIIGVPSDDE